MPCQMIGRVRRPVSLRALAVLFATAFLSARALAQVQVVNMIPNAMSDETNRDSEPYIAVNPANPLLIAATAFLLTPAASPNGPLLVSTDGGTTWVAQNVIPSNPNDLNTYDITIRFNSAGTALYAGLLRAPTVKLEIQRTTDMTLTTPFTLLNTPRFTDQPYTYARTVTGWFDSGKDRIWVGNNENAVAPKSATVDQSLDAGIAVPAFSQVRIDFDAPVARDNYQVRTAAHPDGHVYAAFYRRKGSISGGYNVDVVVVRDDNWGKTMPPFQNLVDTATVVAGQNVVTMDPVSDTLGSSVALGREWWGGDLYLTVDPNNSARVYISYSDSQVSAPRTLHLRRSDDYGQTWGPDLLTVSSAKNAAIAINSHGTIAYVYQQLAGTSPNTHWQTHLRRSTDDGAMWDDVMLADFPAEGTGSPSGSRIIGDYLNMVAVGKNFYGVFSSFNNLSSATFPAGVTWQRNKTPDGDPSPHLLGVDGVTTVTPSIDPFFFRTTEVDPAADFYVRDWTDSSTVHDRGQEPSVRANFYSTSDVWNRRTDDPQPFDGNDRPQSQDPQPAAMGHNFAFARITREAKGTAADVSMQYLYSDGGVGVPYVSAGPPAKLHFAGPNTEKTPGAGSGYQWDLPSGASNHVCLAIEISTGTDPIISPSLLGHAPGWPTTDLMVVADNNKAQRNMHVFGYGGMAAGAAAAQRMSMYAIVQNAANRMRDVQVGIAIDATSLRSFRRATLQVVGQRTAPRPVKPRDVLTLPKMAPGEKRWVELSFTPAPGARGDAPVEILELLNGFPINGYAFAPTVMPIDEAIRRTLFEHAVVFTRLDTAFGIDGAKRQASAALELLKAERIAPGVYAQFVKAESAAVTAIVAAFVKKAGDDPFGTAAAAKTFGSAAPTPVAAQPAHLSLLNKLDAAQTRRQKMDGDVADIPQNVRWQRELFTTLKTERAKEVADRSARFLSDFAHRNVGVEGFGPLLTSLRDALKEGAARDKSGEAARRLDAIQAGASAAALQKAHREFLLALDAAMLR
jgi:hypothetical protein